jgi:adenosylmethionine-8-amino-7-oxononanoate aminotransferase
MTNQQIKEEDLKYIWHPCSQMKDYEHLPLIPIRSGKGLYLEDFEGKQYIDAISSWWVNIFGHSNPKINQALKEQAESLEHVIFAGFTHKPAIDLAKTLIELTPEPLQKLFFADNGSSAIEVALKMSFHYHKNRGETRPLFISLENSYHGETLAALAVGDVALYKETYKEMMFQTMQALSPALHTETEALEDMRRLLEMYKSQISGVIIEPLVQCAGSMKMYDATYITALRALCDEFEVHLIADEIAVGFGRTGTLFACDQANIAPDFMCLSKGLTAGYLPLSVVLTSNDVYNAFYCDYNEGKSFLHSHSYTGNALGCAVANATLAIFKDENIIENNKKTIEHIATKLEKFKTLPQVKEIRQRGMIAAVELIDYDPKKRMGLQIYQYALDHNVLLRPLGNIVYFMPPYIITPSEVDTMMDVAFKAIKLLNDTP